MATPIALILLGLLCMFLQELTMLVEQVFVVFSAIVGTVRLLAYDAFYHKVAFAERRALGERMSFVICVRACRHKVNPCDDGKMIQIRRGMKECRVF